MTCYLLVYIVFFVHGPVSLLHGYFVCEVLVVFFGANVFLTVVCGDRVKSLAELMNGEYIAVDKQNILSEKEYVNILQGGVLIANTRYQRSVAGTGTKQKFSKVSMRRESNLEF